MKIISSHDAIIDDYDDHSEESIINEITKGEIVCF